MTWTVTDETVKYGLVITDFEGTGSYELPLQLGKSVFIKEECEDWYRGYQLCDRDKIGIFPKSFIHMLSSNKESKVVFGESQTVYKENIDPLIDEIHDVLSEWLDFFFTEKFLLEEEYVIKSCTDNAQSLLRGIRQLNSLLLTKDQTLKTKKALSQTIEAGNRLLKRDVLSRNEFGELIELTSTSIADVLQQQENRNGPTLSANHRFSKALSTVSVDEGITSPSFIGRRTTHFRPIGRRGSNASPSSSKDNLNTTRLTGHRETMQLYFEFTHLTVFVGEDNDCIFRLYDYNTQEFIREPYVIRISSKGMPIDLDKYGNMKTIFTDILTDEYIKDDSGKGPLLDHLYIVCTVIRNGKLVSSSAAEKSSNSTTKPGGVIFRRPFGCGILPLSEMSLKDEKSATESKIELFTCSEQNFHEIHNNIICGNKNTYEQLGRTNEGVVVAYKIIKGHFHEAMKTEPLMFENANFCKAPELPAIIEPGFQQDALYVLLHSGSFKQGTKKSAKNMEVKFTVVNNVTGEIRQRCICDGVGNPMFEEEFKSVVYYHNNNPKWNELIRIDLPHEEWPTHHIRITYAHASSATAPADEKTPSFSWIPLMKDGIPIVDGTYDLIIAKSEKKADKKGKETLTYYLECDSWYHVTDVEHSMLASVKSAKKPSVKKASSKIFITPQEMKIQTILCSTNVVHNKPLNDLLHWRTIDKDIPLILKNGEEIPPQQSVQFATHILNELISMLTEDKENRKLIFDKTIFHLGTIISTDIKVLDAINIFLSQHFDNQHAFSAVIESLSAVFKKPSKFLNHRLFMKSLVVLFNLIRYSFCLHLNETHYVPDRDFSIDESPGMMEFQEQIKSLANDFLHYLSDHQTAKHNTDTFEHLSTIVSDINKFFPSDEACEITSRIIRELVDTDVARVKIKFIIEITKSSIFSAPSEVLPQAILCVLLDLIRKNSLSSQLFSPLQRCISRVLSIPISNETREIVLDLVEPILSAMTATFDSRLIVLTLDLFHVISKEQFNKLIARFNNEEKLKEILLQLIDVFKKIHEYNFCKENLSLNFSAKMIISRTISFLAESVIHFFSSGSSKGEVPNQEKQTIVFNYCKLLMEVSCDEALQIERFPLFKRYYILDNFGDLRLNPTEALEYVWNSIDNDFRALFIPSLKEFFTQAMICNKQIRKCTIPMLFSFRECGQFETNPEEFDVAIIDALQPLIDSGFGDMSFVEDLDILKSDVRLASFLPVLKELTRLHMELRILLAVGMEQYVDERNSTTVKLMELYRDKGRMDKYIDYVHSLKNFHIKDDSFSEAGFTLMLHSNLLEWSDKKIPASNLFPEQTEEERKIQLYNEIADYLDKGKQWELAIEFSKELSVHYEAAFNYSKLAENMHRIATFYNNIVTKERYAPEYFRVGFYGHGFPDSLRSKTFVYRGLELERLSNFCDRMADQYPEAALIRSNKAVPQNIIDSADQHIQIVKVDPKTNEEKLVKFQGIPNISDNIIDYYRANEVNLFTSIIGYRKDKKLREFEDAWMLKTDYQIEDNLPGTLLRSEVIKTTEREIAPIEVAEEMMSNKNNELLESFRKVKAGNTALSGTFSMMLNGVLDAAVSGGPMQYREIFIDDPEYLVKHPEHAEVRDKLIKSFSDQIEILEPALILHEKIVDAAMMALHERQIQLFFELTGRKPVDTESN